MSNLILYDISYIIKQLVKISYFKEILKKINNMNLLLFLYVFPHLVFITIIFIIHITLKNKTVRIV
jgi:hypothetical protein